MKIKILLSFVVYISLQAGCGSSSHIQITTRLNDFDNTIESEVGLNAVETDIARRLKIQRTQVNIEHLTQRQQLVCAAIAHYTNPKKTETAQVPPMITLAGIMKAEGNAVVATIANSTLRTKLATYVATLNPAPVPKPATPEAKADE